MVHWWWIWSIGTTGKVGQQSKFPGVGKRNAKLIVATSRDLTTPNLKYLSSRQAIEDAARFIKYLIEKLNLTKHNKWIVFGGSYSGNLAAWFRLKHPELASGAIASSAPVQAVLDFDEYMEVVDESIGQQCSHQVSLATKQLEELVHLGRWDEIRSLFHLCPAFNATTKNDLAMFYSMLPEPFALAVQYNNPSKNQIGHLCSTMVNATKYSPLQRYITLVSPKKTNCTVIGDYQQYVQSLRTGTTRDRLWWYQTCTEFGYFQSSSYAHQPFGHGFPVQFFIQICQDAFDKQYDREYIAKAIEATNHYYGGRGLNVTNVMFVNGAHDPWHVLGVLQPLNPTTPTIVIPQASHCLDMLASNPKSDPPQLTRARERIQQYIGQLLAQ